MHQTANAPFVLNPLPTPAIRPPVWRDRMADIDCPIEDLRLPRDDGPMDQDIEWCEIVLEGRPRRIRFHDYDEIYAIPGLYERLFYESLGCCSPSRVTRLLEEVVLEQGGGIDRLRVLDVGAGNGMVGDELAARQAQRLVGIDIIPEARKAQRRDRPDIYDDYHVCDLTRLPADAEESLRGHDLNAVTCVAALGFGDIPTAAFLKALDLVETPAWIAFNLKEDFLADAQRDPSGFAALIDTLTRSGILRPEAYRRYNHRLNTAGQPLYYVAMIARKLADVPAELLDASAASGD